MYSKANMTPLIGSGIPPVNGLPIASAACLPLDPASTSRTLFASSLTLPKSKVSIGNEGEVGGRLCVGPIEMKAEDYESIIQRPPAD